MNLSRKKLFECKTPLVLSTKSADLALQDINFSSDEVSLRLDISRSLSTADVNGEVVCEINEECDRCLKEFKRDIFGSFRIVVVDEEYVHSNSDDSDKIIFPTEKDLLDISSIIHDSIVLEKSMKEVCIENCKGLCSACGADLNLSDCKCENKELDERWSPLKNLKLHELENYHGTSKKKTV